MGEKRSGSVSGCLLAIAVLRVHQLRRLIASEILQRSGTNIRFAGELALWSRYARRSDI